MKGDILYQGWTFFHRGYGLLTLPISVFQMLAIGFLVVKGYLAFEAFIVFAVIGSVGLVIVSILIGIWHTKRSKFFLNQLEIDVEANGIQAHVNRVNMEALLAFYAKCDLQPTGEFVRLLEYWRRIDERWKWKP